jgi:hypothetical protein
MMKNSTRNWLFIVSILLIFINLIQSVSAEKQIQVEFYYNKNCSTCIPQLKIVNSIKAYYEEHSDAYNETLIFQIKDISINQSYRKDYLDYAKTYGVGYPVVIISNGTNLTIIRKADITKQFLNETINSYLAGLQLNETDLNVHSIDVLFWTIEINTSAYSLPLLTIIIGAVDSFNPCAFFILIFLLNLLIYVKSRRRMLLIGSIFIFFSGLFYFTFMVFLNAIFAPATEHIILFSIIVGIVALSIGLLNIKDFFFYKKGASIGIPEQKKPGIYKRMRSLVKTHHLPAVLLSTIFLAISVNVYELICTVILPTIYIHQLNVRGISDSLSMWYIFFYNVIYVIPLIIIVFIFVFTLSRKKLTEWHGQILKLFSGLMISSFGTILIIDYKLLENIASPIIILIFALLFTLIISYFWKIFRAKSEKKPMKPS